MAKYVALLRGVNVGGKAIVPMEKLRETFEEAGATDVVTYIQSGNVVFTHAQRGSSTVAAALTTAIADAFGFAVPVILRTSAEWAAVISDNPFSGADDDHVHVSFLAEAPKAEALAKLDAASFEPERFVLNKRDIYMLLPGGLGKSKLAGTLARQKALAHATTRNWRTVVKLRELSA